MSPCNPLRRVFLLTAVALLLCAAGAAGQPDGDCRLHIQHVEPLIWTGRANGGYDPLDGVERWQEGQLSVSQQGPGACDFVVGVDAPASGSDASERQATSHDSALRYRLTAADGRPLLDLPIGGAGSLFSGSFTEQTAVIEGTYRISLPAGQTVEPGIYQDDVVLRLFSDESGLLTEQDTATLHVVIQVQSSLWLSIEGLPGGGRDLDLGDLTQGAAGGFSVVVRGNARYRIQVLSQNSGALVLEGGGTLQEAFAIPYQLLLSGEELDLSGQATVRADARPGPAGRAHTAEVTVAPAQGATAGDYSDVLTFSVEAQ